MRALVFSKVLLDFQFPPTKCFLPPYIILDFNFQKDNNLILYINKINAYLTIRKFPLIIYVLEI
jgi:hypothetical protein